MKANEFVKKFGIVRAKQILDHAPEGAASFDFIGIKYSNGSRLVGKKHIGLNHLKRLVESHELVEYYGGLDYARIDIFLHNTGSNYASRDKLQQAIADVESCQ